jgi:putative phosphoesterase
MKILVLSDSHRQIDRCYAAAWRENPDCIFHLGDYMADAQALQKKLPHLRFEMIAGNCDWELPGEGERLVELEGFRLFLTHGHHYGVKSGCERLIRRGTELRADAVLFGHTHRALLDDSHGFWLMNPGQMERDTPDRPAGYGVITIENGTLTPGNRQFG